MASSSYQTSPTATNYNSTTKAHHQAQKAHHHHDHDIVVVVVPFPAQGHLNQLLHLSRIILSYNIPVHFVGTPIHNRQALTRLHGWEWDPRSMLNFHDFKVPPFPSPPPDPNALRQTHSNFPSHLLPSFQTAAMHLRDPVRSLLSSISSVARRVVVIHDSLMASVVQDAVHLSNCESYTFHSVSAFTMFFYFWNVMGTPMLQSSIASHIPQVPSLEGCFTTQFVDFMSSQYEFHKFSSGTIYNTTRAIEGPYMDLIERMVSYKTHWALGPFNPLIPSSTRNNNKHPCMDWLDEQEDNSVLYVSFGTTTAFKEEQIMELAIGLERSKQKFLWVLRDADKGDVFKEDGKREVKVPKGFEERVKGMGMVVRDWAPQLEILGHRATGGFMSHCGWNSCMESITMGVPIVTWPMHSDQPRNRVLVTEVLRIGLVVKDWSHRDEVVAASAVEDAVRRLMATEEGEAIRERAMKLMNAIHKSKDEGGVSRVEIDSFIAHITR